MPDIMTMKIKTLTPIWTGGVSGKCDRLHETGIIGSLRWWYEIIVRGLGKYVCDPTDKKRCELDQDKFRKALKSDKSVQEALSEQICPICQLFGCGGWKRRFKFHIEDTDTTPLYFRTSYTLNKNWLKLIYAVHLHCLQLFLLTL